MRAELASPGIGASVSVALNDVGPTSSKLSLIGVGYSTSKVSICASHPHDLNCASTLSAFALLWAEPTWLGSAAMVFIQPPISAGTIDASNRRSRSTVADAFEAVCAPSELATRSAAKVPEPVQIVRRILPPCPRSDAEDTSALLRAITNEQSPFGHRQSEVRAVGDYHVSNVEGCRGRAISRPKLAVPVVRVGNRESKHSLP